MRKRCTRSAYIGFVAWTVSANLEAACCCHLCFCPKLYLTLQKGLGQCSHQGTVCTRAAKVDRFVEKLLKYLTQCAHGACAVRELPPSYPPQKRRTSPPPLPPCNPPPPHMGGNRHLPQKAWKIPGAKENFYKAPKLIYTVILW